MSKYFVCEMLYICKFFCIISKHMQKEREVKMKVLGSPFPSTDADEPIEHHQ